MQTPRYSDSDRGDFEQTTEEARRPLTFTPSPYEKAQDALYQAKERFAEAPSRMYFVAMAVLLFLIVGFTWSASYGHIERSGNSDMQARLRASEKVYQRITKLADDLVASAGGEEAIQMSPVNTEPPNVQGFIQDLYHSSFTCPRGRERIGRVVDGGKWMCGWDEIVEQDPLVIYSLGVGDVASGGSTWELELLEKTHGSVWAYDFSVQGFGPSLRDRKDLLHRAHFKPYRIAGTTNKTHDPPMYNLEALLTENEHDYIDIFKVDVEGSEFPLLTAMLHRYAQLGRPLPFSQLLLEVHLWGRSFQEINRLMRGLEHAGLRPFNWETNQYSPSLCAEVAYVNIAHPRSPFYLRT